jgi:Fe-S cluster assembly protein SufD
MLVDVPAGAQLTEPVVVELTGTDAEAVVYGHLVFRIGAHASATVVLRHLGSARYASSVSVLVGDGADLNFVGLQDWAPDAVHAGHVGLRIGRDAHVRTVTASLGGDLVRLVETAEYDGPGGELEQFGLYFVDAGQHIEHRLFVDHNAPHTRSRVDYRGALQGEGAHSVWVGDVLIRKVAEGINTYETNKNLVLTDGCRADSVPNLEIETGEIEGAGHASTTGRFDDEQLFYLRSRGIPEDEARRLVVHGFFADIIRRIGVPEVETRLLAAVERELEVIVGTPAGVAP